jgi:hypothetical protein
MLGGLAAPSHKITPAGINSARDTFKANETRDLFYRAAPSFSRNRRPPAFRVVAIHKTRPV